MIKWSEFGNTIVTIDEFTAPNASSAAREHAVFVNEAGFTPA